MQLACLQQGACDPSSYFQGLPLRLAQDATCGRYLVATRDIAAGEVVLACPPFLTALLRTHRKRVCHACMRGSAAGRLTISCTGCGIAHYCSQACREAHAAGTPAVGPPGEVPAAGTASTAAVAAAPGDNGPNVLLLQGAVRQPYVTPVPHKLVCGVLRRFSGSFKYDADMEAIMCMCLEALARQRLDQQQQQQQQQEHQQHVQSSQHQQESCLQQHSQHSLESHQREEPEGTGSQFSRQDGDGERQASSRSLGMADFLALQSHMDEIHQPDRQDWVKGARLLLTSMQKEGWPQPLPSEEQLLHMCGRILSNNFGVWAGQTLPPAPPLIPAVDHHSAAGTQPTPLSVRGLCENEAQVTQASCCKPVRAVAGQVEGLVAQLTTTSLPAREQAGSLGGTDHQGCSTSNGPPHPAAPPRPQVPPDANHSQQGDASTTAGLEGRGEVGAGTKEDTTGPGPGSWTKAMVGRQLYIAASYFNHSCSPNCVVEPSGQWAVVRAGEGGIPCGAQACISYIDVDAPASARRAELRRCFFFTCECDRCQAGQGATQAAWAQPGRQPVQQRPKAVHAREQRKGGGHKGGGVSHRHTKKHSQ